MCTVFLAIEQHEDYPLILLSNRDEFYERKTSPMHWWNDRGILAGRDEEAGGTWLAIDRSLNFSLVTNYRDFRNPSKGERSRGEIPLRTLGSDEAGFDALFEELDKYDGFNLISGDASGFRYMTNRPMQRQGQFGPGLYGLSNANLDDPWPKVKNGKSRLRSLIENNDLSHEELLLMMSDTHIAADEDLPDTGVPLELERALSATCINWKNYGTRVTTLLMVDRNGIAMVFEQNKQSGELRDFRFKVEQ